MKKSQADVRLLKKTVTYHKFNLIFNLIFDLIQPLWRTVGLKYGKMSLGGAVFLRTF